MTWEVVDVRRSRQTSGVPKARVARGALSLNAAAVGLLGNMAEREHAELMMDLEDGRVGIRFLEECSGASVPVRRKTGKGKPGGGLTISSKAHMRELFGDAGVSTESTHYAVSLDPRERNVLVLAQ